MQTVLTRKIDGHDIIVGFSQCAVDGAATKVKVKAALQKTDEFKAAEAKKKEILELLTLRKGAHDKAKATNNAADKKRFENEYVALNAQAKSKEVELHGLSRALKTKESELMKSEAVYFEPPAYEIKKSDADILDLREKVADGKGLVRVDGVVLEDNRGMVYAESVGDGWRVTEINSIGVSIPADAILYADLDAEQKEAVDLQMWIDRVAKMPENVKLMDRQFEENKALNDSAFMRSKLEIQGVADALEQAQEWYQGKMQTIELVYG